MSDDAGTLVECQFCGEEFDPTAAGGWCTNPDCGEWQYEGADAAAGDRPDAETGATGGGEQAATGDHESAVTDEAGTGDDDPGAVEPDATGTAEPTGSPSGDEDGQPDVAAGADEVPEAGEAATEPDEPATEPGEPATEPGEPSAEPGPDDATARTEEVESGASGPDAEPFDCPDCGETLDADVSFCPACGTDVSDYPRTGPVCPSCGADVDPGDNFCAACGEDLESARATLGAASSPQAGESSGGAAASAESSTGTAASSASGAGAESASGSRDEGESASASEAPQSLVLRVRGEEIAVSDGDTVGRSVRRILTETGGTEDEAVRVHREHVQFVREGGQFYLVDLGDNPTALNGDRLSKGDREAVGPGDEVELSGIVTLAVEAP